MKKMVLIDIYNDGVDLLLVDDHDGKLGASINEWHELDRRKVGGEDCDWVDIEEWLPTHGYPLIEFEQLGL